MITKQEILTLVSEYITEKHKSKSWIAGKDWVQYAGPYFTDDEYVRSISTLLDEWLVLGKDAIEFESKFPPLLGKKYGIVTNSGSSSNLLMMAALSSQKIKSNENKPSVIVPVAGFPTTLNPIIQLGYTPVFVDIELDTLNLNLNQVESAAKRGHKYITFAHVLGNPPNMDRLMEIVNKYGLTLLEDCCDGLGSTYDGKYLGSFGRFSSCSFYPAHHMTSLPYDESILLQSPSGNIKSYEIGDFVDNINFKGWKCPSFDKHGKINWREITGVVSHPFTDECLYKITTQTGRHSTVTGNHSLFKLDKDGNIITITSEKLKIGDYIIVPNKLPNIETNSSINFIKYKKGTWSKIISNLKIDISIANLLGWFVAEGSLYKSNNGNYNITFTLHESEINIANTLALTLKNKFNITSHIYKKHGKSISLQCSNKALFEFLLEHCGNGSKNKKIPTFIFTSLNDIKWEFLKSYFNGDGHHHIIKKSSSDSFDCKTVSKQLAYDLHHILLMIGVSSRISFIPSKIVKILNNKNETITSPTYSICYNNSLQSIINSKSFRHSQIKNLSFPRLKEDLTMLKITNIEKIKYNKKNVYDISVKGYENFISGMGFVVHNTGEGGFVACNTMEDEKIIRSLREWGRGCYCVGKKANLSTKGSCGCRFKNWLPSLSTEIFDHKYVYEEIGYNLKPIELQCSMGLAQIEKLPFIHMRRKENHSRLVNIFSKYEEFFHIHKATEKSDPSWFAFPITVKNGAPFKRSEFTHYLEDNKIQTRNYFGGNLLLHPAYNNIKSSSWLGGTILDPKLLFPIATKVTTDTLFLGTSPVISNVQLDYVETIVNKFFNTIQYGNNKN